jgi:hypothetical protein
MFIKENKIKKPIQYVIPSEAEESMFETIKKRSLHALRLVGMTIKKLNFMNNINNFYMHSQKFLIIIFFIFFAASALFLFWQNERELDPNRNKNWWTLAFAAPQESNNLSFIVENHSDQNNFRYKIIANKETFIEETLEIKRGETKTISPSVAAIPNTRISVIVTNGKEQKEIYK